MKNFLLLQIFVIVLFFSGCSKKQEDIKTVKPDETKTEQIETKNNTPADTGNRNESTDDKTEKKSSGQTEKIRVTTSEVKTNIGKNVILKGYVAGVVVREKVAYLNFDNNYPKNTCSVTIFASEFDKFGDLSRFENKNVEVSGKITEYQGKPQIIIKSPGQLKIVN